MSAPTPLLAGNFTGEITIDDHRFGVCQFIDCTLHYSGGPISIEAATYHNVRFGFHGPAESTLELIAYLYARPDTRPYLERLLRAYAPTDSGRSN